MPKRGEARKWGISADLLHGIYGRRICELTTRGRKLGFKTKSSNFSCSVQQCSKNIMQMARADIYAFSSYSSSISEEKEEADLVTKAEANLCTFFHFDHQPLRHLQTKFPLEFNSPKWQNASRLSLRKLKMSNLNCAIEITTLYIEETPCAFWTFRRLSS